MTNFEPKYYFDLIPCVKFMWKHICGTNVTPLSWVMVTSHHLGPCKSGHVNQFLAKCIFFNYPHLHHNGVEFWT